GARVRGASTVRLRGLPPARRGQTRARSAARCAVARAGRSAWLAACGPFDAARRWPLLPVERAAMLRAGLGKAAEDSVVLRREPVALRARAVHATSDQAHALPAVSLLLDRERSGTGGS